jgi:hypothetical protein
MLRADNVICGTTTTGTGTLTLAATPGPPGGMDFDVWARATGIGFANSTTPLVSYTILEYTDGTFSTAKQEEKGVGTLTLGGSSGIANATLARTTIQQRITSMNAQPASYAVSPGTGITIGTAANTLVFIGVSSADVPAFSPYILTASNITNIGAFPAHVAAAGSGLAFSSTAGLVSGDRFFTPFIWLTRMLVKRASCYVTVADAGNSNLDMRLYDIGTDGKAGKLLYDFGLVGTTNTSMSTTGWAQTGAAGNGFDLYPGEYFMEFCVTFTNTPNLGIITGTTGGLLNSGRFGVSSTGVSNTGFYSTGGVIGAAPDPAAPASWGNAVAGYAIIFTMSPT